MAAILQTKIQSSIELITNKLDNWYTKYWIKLS